MVPGSQKVVVGLGEMLRFNFWDHEGPFCGARSPIPEFSTTRLKPYFKTVLESCENIA